MKLATFSNGGARRIGLIVDEEIVDLSAACPELPTDMVAFLEAGKPAMQQARAALGSSHRMPLASVKLHAPIPAPTELMIVGGNYTDHLAESTNIKGMPAGTVADIVQGGGKLKQDVPIIVGKTVNSVTGPNDPVYKPRISDQFDYEGEFAIVIGTTCRNVPYSQAGDVIAGYTVCNDLSVRDWQFKSSTMILGKSFDTCCPMGPCIATADSVDPHAMRIRTWVNGELRQDSRTDCLEFDSYRLVEFLSSLFTLRAGTVILTGTMAGVAIAMDPPKWLKVGDVVEVEADAIGRIVNAVIAEPDGPFYG